MSGNPRCFDAGLNFKNTAHKAGDRRQRMLSFVIIIFLAGATRAEVSNVVEIESEIRYRYARTEVRSTVTNRDKWDKEITFTMTLPEPAFISNFTILAGGQEHVATVMDSEEARRKYNDAKDMSLTTGAPWEFPKERKFSKTLSTVAELPPTLRRGSTGSRDHQRREFTTNPQTLE